LTYLKVNCQYGEAIGKASQPIIRDSSYIYTTLDACGRGDLVIGCEEETTWLGFRRPDGSHGARTMSHNPWRHSPDEICHFVRNLTWSRLRHLQEERNRIETIARVYTGLAKESQRGISYLWLEHLAEEIKKSGKRVEVLSPDTSDTIALIGKGIKLARELAWEASKLRREPCADSHLALGVKCGSSDPTSGIAGNPVIGYVYDKLIKAGGTAFFGENTEIIGAEHVFGQTRHQQGGGRESRVANKTMN
jgi:altronate dehydratase large subunit